MLEKKTYELFCHFLHSFSAFTHALQSEPCVSKQLIKASSDLFTTSNNLELQLHDERRNKSTDKDHTITLTKHETDMLLHALTFLQANTKDKDTFKKVGLIYSKIARQISASVGIDPSHFKDK